MEDLRTVIVRPRKQGRCAWCSKGIYNRTGWCSRKCQIQHQAQDTKGYERQLERHNEARTTFRNPPIKQSTKVVIRVTMLIILAWVIYTITQWSGGVNR